MIGFDFCNYYIYMYRKNNRTYRLYIILVSLYLVVLLPITNHVSFTHDHQLHKQNFLNPSKLDDTLNNETVSEHQHEHVFSVEAFIDRSIFTIYEDKYSKVSIMDSITQIIYIKSIFPPPRALNFYF